MLTDDATVFLKNMKTLEPLPLLKTSEFNSVSVLTVQRTPEWLKNSELHSHQLKALNWLRSMWLQSKGGIVVRNAGQGTTAAVASFLRRLKEEVKCVHPRCC